MACKCQLLVAGCPTNHSGAANVVTAADEDPLPPETFARLDGYLDNLVAAATTKCTTLMQLIKNNNTLTTNVASLTASVAALSSAYTLLAGTPAPTTAKPPNARKPLNLDPNGY
jgi:hypothetical protein